MPDEARQGSPDERLQPHAASLDHRFARREPALAQLAEAGDEDDPVLRGDAEEDAEGTEVERGDDDQPTAQALGKEVRRLLDAIRR